MNHHVAVPKRGGRSSGAPSAETSPAAGRARGARSLIDRAIDIRLPGWLLVVTVIAGWQLSASTGILNSPTFLSPALIAERWWREATQGTLLIELGRTLKLMFTGYLLAAVVASVTGILMGRVRLIWSVLEPVAEMIRPVPISAVVPILILVLGIDDPLKITAVFWGSFFPVLLNAYAGVRSVPRTMVETGQTFRLSELQMLREIIIPQALPSIFVGLRIALTISLIVAVFSEMLAGFSGIGYFIMQAQQTLSVDRLWAGVLTLSMLGYVLNLIFLQVEEFFVPWREGSARRQAR